MFSGAGHVISWYCSITYCRTALKRYSILSLLQLAGHNSSGCRIFANTQAGYFKIFTRTAGSSAVFFTGTTPGVLGWNLQADRLFITKTHLYNFDPLKPHSYTVKLGFTEVYISFLIFAQKHRLWYSLEPPRRGGSYEYPQSIFREEIWKI